MKKMESCSLKNMVIIFNQTEICLTWFELSLNFYVNLCY